jgi:hypothetical protein
MGSEFKVQRFRVSSVTQNAEPRTFEPCFLALETKKPGFVLIIALLICENEIGDKETINENLQLPIRRSRKKGIRHR